MSENWNVIKQEVSTFRNYVHKLPTAAREKAAYCYLLSIEEIQRLLAQKGNGTQLDGLRIYLGANIVDGHMVPDIHIVACEKEGERYDDYNVPKAMPHHEEKMTTDADVEQTGGGTGGTKPCPIYCSAENILNS